MVEKPTSNRIDVVKLRLEHTVLCLISAPPLISAPLLFKIVNYKELKEKSEIFEEINAK